MVRHSEERKQIAKEHTTMMDELYPNEIQQSFNDSIIWYADDAMTTMQFIEHGKVVKLDVHEAVAKLSENEKQTNFDFKIDVSQHAVFHTGSRRIAVLNMADFTRAGGLFLDGAIAQEEALCHSSFLYNVLRNFSNTYYAPNSKEKNRGLYHHRGIYTPNVLFIDKDGNKRFADVITIAAPNKSPAIRYGAFSEMENWEALKNRILFMKLMCSFSATDLEEVILGAWGCGVFKQNPIDVARWFGYWWNKSIFDKVTFAIPEESKLELFKEYVTAPNKLNK